MTGPGRCRTGDHRAPDGGGSCSCGLVTIVPAPVPHPTCPGGLALCGVPCGCRGRNPSHWPAAAVDDAFEQLTAAATARRLAWFTDDDLRAELDRRAGVTS